MELNLNPEVYNEENKKFFEMLIANKLAVRSTDTIFTHIPYQRPTHLITRGEDGFDVVERIRFS
jgi:hypothetical protein